ncbi:hypothetical protein B9Z55_028751 [Caenorhabditis nigoni]|nr:hypothetical protein B9Z55_028751 [Caenorhabditis nigoni]
MLFTAAEVELLGDIEFVEERIGGRPTNSALASSIVGPPHGNGASVYNQASTTGDTVNPNRIVVWDPPKRKFFGPPGYVRPTKKSQQTEAAPSNEDTSCNSRTQPPTFLFAYSNDLSSKTVSDTWNAFLDVENSVDLQYSWFGSVRFDTENMDIEFHKDFNDVTSTIQNNLPDPNQGYQNFSVGSNVFDVIEKFYSNTQAPVCGSIICILLKRYPNEADISRLVSKIRSHHTFIHVMTSATPSGGSQPKSMYFVSSKTNGMGPFESDDQFFDIIGRFPMFATPYPVYATTVQVNGSGTINLPDLYLPKSDDYWVAITYQDHVPIDSFQNLNLRWTNPGDSGNFAVNSNDVSGVEDGGTYACGWNGFGATNYSMTLEYSYSSQDMQNLQIRIYSGTPLNNWLPYSD